MTPARGSGRQPRYLLSQIGDRRADLEARRRDLDDALAESSTRSRPLPRLTWTRLGRDRLWSAEPPDPDTADLRRLTWAAPSTAWFGHDLNDEP